ncbi:glycosyl hydrolase family 95 catalytic domain-containing protein [Haloferula sp. A504]|uniref:glycosyl hydrolase family 95 catalytic domain-containing protein n=1 Tax=Haloferula sp. A504 TaxID=3373601 RepID=UPI0031C6A811|nr:glycoside hydrolase N-terminal domain-containing protein [Verrucomicrobiaceae bacterium E54]
MSISSAVHSADHFEAPTLTTKVAATTPPLRWEDAMLSGNGTTGIMVLGLPVQERIIVNHEKLWTVGNDYRPETPDLGEAWKEAREIALEGRYLDADLLVAEEAVRKNQAMYGDQFTGRRPAYDRTHPAFHLEIITENNGTPLEYRRETNLETGEISVTWQDNKGAWFRRAFVSRTDDVIVIELLAPAGEEFDASIRLVEAPGKLDGDIAGIDIDHTGSEVYYHATYGRRMGKPQPEGYHALARVLTFGGSASGVADQRLDVKTAERVLIIMRLEYLDDAGKADRAALRKQLASLPASYDELLAPHAAAHGEMFRRVTLDLGGPTTSTVSSEQLIAAGLRGESLPELFEALHAVGRYALTCGATGELAPSLMGLWGNEWTPPWDGRYTFDANLNLAMAGVAQGNLPEVMHTYASFLQRYRQDWRDNARRLYGAEGAVTDLCQGWRHGAVLMPAFAWTGGVGWLASYLYDYAVYTGDEKFLREHAIPMLKDAAEFYASFLPMHPELNDRHVFYPSISPENVPVMEPVEQTTNVVPNATSEIAICREVLTTLIAACRKLDIESENIKRWEALLARLPDYGINSDGAIAEWSYPGLGDRYHHRHLSHLYPVYPGREVSPQRKPELFEAARIAMQKRIEAGLGNKSAHGQMHAALVAARLRDAELVKQILNYFARNRYLNSSLMTGHNPGPKIYNLDATFSLPGLLMEMLVQSDPGEIELLAALPQDVFPKGRIRGCLARGGITVEELNWNTLMGWVKVTLHSEEAQEISLRFGHHLRFVDAVDPARKDAVTTVGRGLWKIDLPAGESLELYCRY